MKNKKSTRFSFLSLSALRIALYELIAWRPWRFKQQLSVPHRVAPRALYANLNLDEITESGLALREALPVRSAEYWMEMGCPELALEELETLSEPASGHDWPRRIRQQATLATAQAA